MFKKIALLLGLMTSMLFSVSALAAVNAADPYALVDQAAQQTFARLKADKSQVKSNPDHLRVIIREELLPYVDNRFAAYKVLGNQIKETTEAQRNAFSLSATNFGLTFWRIAASTSSSVRKLSAPLASAAPSMMTLSVFGLPIVSTAS